MKSCIRLHKTRRRRRTHALIYIDLDTIHQGQKHLGQREGTESDIQNYGRQIVLNRVRPNPSVLLAHVNALNQGCVARYNITRVELKTFTFSSGAQSRTIDNAVLGNLPKRLLFTMMRNEDFLGSVS